MVAQEVPLVIITRYEHGITELRLNRPKSRNAFSKQLYEHTTQHLRTLSNDTRTRIILLTGSGETFCGGMDIKEASNTTFAKSLIQAAKSFMYALMDTPKIVCAAVSGHVVGIGVTLLMHCDFVYASNGTRFSTPFPEVGLIPEFGSSTTFSAVLGKRRAAEVLLMGRILDVEDMQDVLTAVHGDRSAVVAHAKRVLAEWSARMGDDEWRAVEMGKSFCKLDLKARVDREIDMIERLVEEGVTARLMKGKVGTLAKL